MKRTDTYRVLVSVDGVDLGTWDKMSGGEVDTEETTYRPGGLADRIALGGTRTIGNVTISKLTDEALSDGPNGLHWLNERAGKANIVVTKQPLDADGNAWGRPLVYTGRLKRCTAPDVDSQGNDPALTELEATIERVA